MAQDIFYKGSKITVSTDIDDTLEEFTFSDNKGNISSSNAKEALEELSNASFVKSKYVFSETNIFDSEDNVSRPLHTTSNTTVGTTTYSDGKIFGGWCKSKLKKIVNYTYIKVSYTSNYTVYPVVFYDANNVVISVVEPLSGSERFVEDIVVEIPTDAVYFSVQSRTSADTKILRNVGFPCSSHILSILDKNEELDYYLVNTIRGWKGAKCLFIGDSITKGVGTSKQYWSYLQDFIGIVPSTYANGGEQYTHLTTQITKAVDEGVQYDAVFVFAGTNDWGGSVAIGDFYTEENGQRILNFSGSGFKQKVNLILKTLRTSFPNSQIIIMTPIQRGVFGGNDGSQANTSGLYLSDYVAAIKEASTIWSMPIINLYEKAAINPSLDEFETYYNSPTTDRLHPNAKGHYRIARAIACELMSITCKVVE